MDIKVPVLGFGCSSLTGTTHRNSIRLLETAFDAGVRHFDVARYYGYGEAENILGTFVKNRRSEVTITTKFGIKPPHLTFRRRLVLYVGRRVLRLVPSARRHVPQRAKPAVTSGAFSVRDAQNSLEESLKALGTDHVDFFLLHDYEFNPNPCDELLKFLDDALATGKIRYYGIGTDIGNVRSTVKGQPKLCDVVQFKSNVMEPSRKLLPENSPSHLVVTHGSLSGSYVAISSFLKANPSVAKKWSADLDLNCSANEVLSALLLNYAVEENENGIVLFSSKNVSRVSANIKAVQEARFSKAQFKLFGMLVSRDMKSSLPAVAN
jgi:aryl-alcohol dehydrogenase-like predicted oxidoreductase